MNQPTSSLDEAERHVRDAEKQVVHQVNVIADLERDGDEQAVEGAKEVLLVLQRNLELARDRLRTERVLHGMAR